MNNQYFLKTNNENNNITLTDDINDKVWIFHDNTVGGKILWSIYSDAQQWSASNVFIDNDIAEFLISHFNSIG